MKLDVATAQQSSSKPKGGVQRCRMPRAQRCLPPDHTSKLNRDRRMMSLKCGLLWSFSFVILSLSIVGCFRFYTLVYRVSRL